jgi:hypothetical protein
VPVPGRGGGEEYEGIGARLLLFMLLLFTVDVPVMPRGLLVVIPPLLLVVVPGLVARPPRGAEPPLGATPVRGGRLPLGAMPPLGPVYVVPVPLVVLPRGGFEYTMLPRGLAVPVFPEFVFILLRTADDEIIMPRAGALP